jgi:hypothetical protein
MFDPWAQDACGQTVAQTGPCALYNPGRSERPTDRPEYAGALVLGKTWLEAADSTFFPSQLVLLWKHELLQQAGPASW